MFPTVRNAGVCTSGEGWPSNSTSRPHTFALMTAEMRSFRPSDKYDSAQHASVRTSTSMVEMSVDSVGSAGETHSKGGEGLPLQRLDNVHVAFRMREGRLVSE